MIILAQAAVAAAQTSDSPTTAGWIGIITTALAILAILAVPFVRWWNGRMDKTDQVQLADLKSKREETLRTEALPIIPMMIPAVPEPFKVVYIGTEAADKDAMNAAWQGSTYRNRLMIYDSPSAAKEYLLANSKQVGFVIIFVEELDKGYEFLRMVKSDNTIRDIPVFFIDGLGADGPLKTFEMGGQGFLQKPFDLNALTAILKRLGYSSTLSKDA